jgi:hydrogenase maturation protease
MTQGPISMASEINSFGADCPASTIIVGLGNPILGDDGIGWRIAEEVEKQLILDPKLAKDIDVECLALGGLSLMEHLVGYQRAILIDAMNIGIGPQGSIHCFALDELPDYAGGHLTSTHDTSLPTALSMGSSMGALLPDEITIIGIESANVYDFSEELTPPVAEALPTAVKTVLDLIK